MLNCCIERKKARDEARKTTDGGKERERKVSGGCQNGRFGPESVPPATTASDSAREVGKSWESWSDSEDEFFECLSDQEEMEFPPTAGEKGGAKDVSKAKPEGRLHPHGNMTLINLAEPLYIPITQVRVSLTYTQTLGLCTSPFLS